MRERHGELVLQGAYIEVRTSWHDVSISAHSSRTVHLYAVCVCRRPISSVLVGLCPLGCIGTLALSFVRPTAICTSNLRTHIYIFPRT